MLGAIAGDIMASPYEWCDAPGSNFQMFSSHTAKIRGQSKVFHPHYTDETVMTLAVAKWLTKDDNRTSGELIRIMQELGREHINCGFPRRFKEWIGSEKPYAQYSYGNGAAMRVSPIGILVPNLYEALKLARMAAEVSHSHIDAIKGAEAMVQAVWMAQHGRSKEDIKFAMENDFDYDFSMKEKDLKHLLAGCIQEPAIVNGEKIEEYVFIETGRIDTSATLTVTAAIRAFLEGSDFEDTVRKAICYGGDSDTIASMAGAIAGSYYKDGISKEIISSCNRYLPKDLREILDKFEDICLGKKRGSAQKVASRQDDSFKVVKIGDKKIYLVSDYRRDLIEALKKKFGNDIKILKPSVGWEEIKEMCKNKKDGTYIEQPRPDIRTIYFQGGEFKTSGTVAGPRLVSAKVRQEHRQYFFEIREHTIKVKKELQSKCGYNGEGNIHFERAYYPVIFQDSVEIWQGDIFAGSVLIDPGCGLLRIETGGGIGPMEWYENRTESVFTSTSIDGIKEAMNFYCLDEGVGINDKNRLSNVAIANDDIARSKDETLLGAIEKKSTPKEGTTLKR